MGLRSVIAKATTSAFTAVGDIKESATYRRVASVYNPTTGSNVATNTDYTVTAIFTKFENIVIDKVIIQLFDIKMLVQAKDISVVPNIATDKVVRAGKVYNVLNYKLDPAGAMYTIQLRAT